MCVVDQIKLQLNNKTATFLGDDRIVRYCTSNGVIIEAKVPADWGLTRVFQFMESLLLTSGSLV